MSGSMWSFSGKHWLRQAVAWSLFALVVGIAADAGADPVDPDSAVSNLRIEFAAPSISAGGLVAIDIKSLDLAQLDAGAFGDQEEASPAR